MKLEYEQGIDDAIRVLRKAKVKPVQYWIYSESKKELNPYCPNCQADLDSATQELSSKEYLLFQYCPYCGQAIELKGQ